MLIDIVEVITKASIGLKLIKIQENQTRIYNPYKNTKLTNRMRRYIDYRIKNMLGKVDINLIMFNKRAYN